MLFVGFLVVILSFLGGQWLSGRVGVDLYWPMAVTWGLWAAYDARRHDLKRYERVFPLEPFALLAAVTIMWPVSLPWYLRLRHRAGVPAAVRGAGRAQAFRAAHGQR
jgi:hypothetical protein